MPRRPGLRGRGALQNSENPTLNFGLLAFVLFNLRAEKFFETAVRVRPLQPFGDGEGVSLVGRSPCSWESPAPKRRVDLSHHRAIRGHTPTVERPEVHLVSGVLPDVAQPRNACV